MKTVLFMTALLAVYPLVYANGQTRLSSLVNPFIGASTSMKLAGSSHGLGKTFPGATTPFGMAQVSPQTITGGDNGSGYSYEHQTIEGFAMTQMSGIGWYGDLGNFLVIPTTGGRMYTLASREGSSIPGWRTRLDKQSERAQAGYYTVRLPDYGITAECTATPHCGFLRFTYPESDTSRIMIDLARRVGGTATVEDLRVTDNHTIEGWMQCTPDGGGWGDGAGNARYTVYFHAEFSQPLTNYGYWTATIPDTASRHVKDVMTDHYLKRIADARVVPMGREAHGRHIGFYTQFPTSAGQQLTLKVGLSFVDIEGARRNFQAEAAAISFDEARERATRLWDDALAKVTITGGTTDEQTIFYTALYHTMIDPRIYEDVDGRYIGGDYKVHSNGGIFTKRTIFSGWDVFRSQFPLQTIINPTLVNDMINSLITLADESGRHYYERWELLNSYSGCMLGNPAIPVIADAWAKGIRSYNGQKALQYAVNSSRKFGNDSLDYTPGNSGISLTLEYAYDDWCVSRLAAMMGQDSIAAEYARKALDYKNIWDPDKGWFRPKGNDGQFLPWPKEGRMKEWYGTVECNPYQQGFFVPHDIDGMANLMGGRKHVLADLEDMMEKTPDNMFWNLYYNHANEPVHFIPYIFSRLGEPWLTQRWTRHICSHAYQNSVDGLRGNEDVGQMSAWYVLTAAGIHQACPADLRYEVTSPVFDSITFRLDPRLAQAQTFTIVAYDNSPQNIYIQRLALNGKPLKVCHITWDDIMHGGKLEVWLGPKPNKHLK